MRASLVRLILTVLSWLPLPVVHRMGAWLGRGLSWFSNDLRDTARTNIRHCFPHWTAQQQQQLEMRCMQETAKAALESGVLWLQPLGRVRSLIRNVSGEEVLTQAIAKGKGVILVAPHLGAWEVVGVYCSMQWPMTNLYRPPRQSDLDGLIRHARERAGAKLVPTDASGVRTLFKALRRGELIGILPDQDPDRASGVFAPFFGVPANTMTLLSRLAAKSGAVVVMGYAERLPRGEGYHLHFQDAAVDVAVNDEVKAATNLNQAVEQCVLQQPDQYQWAYKRFKTRPEGEEKFY